MLNAILYKGLGATDPYQQHILTDATSGYEYLLLSDGTNVWKINSTSAGASSRSSSKKLGMTVSEALHGWLSQRYRHGLIDGSEPGYDFTHGGFKASTNSYRSATNTYLPDQNKITAYTTALRNGKVITLSQVLKSVNPSTHVFYVPVGYYYQGDISEVPSVSEGDASDAANRANYGNKPFDTTSAPTATSEDDDDMMLFLLLPILAIVGVKFLKKNNKRKKR